MIFVFSQRYEIWRAPRAEVRARQKFFWKCHFYDKISLQFFLFGHNSKSEFFRAIWNLKFFWKFDFSSKFWKFENSEKIPTFFGIFHEKVQYSNASTIINSKNIRILKITRIYRIDQRISCWKNFFARAHCLARASRIFYHKRKKSIILNFGARAFLW